MAKSDPKLTAFKVGEVARYLLESAKRPDLNEGS
jgi:hypothetical protein